MFMLETSISTGNAPASSIVLKKIGAILPPKHTPPSFCLECERFHHQRTKEQSLLQIYEMNLYQQRHQHKQLGLPLAMSSLIWLNGPTSPGFQG